MSYICEISEFNQWLKKAAPLEKFIYFAGESLSYGIVTKKIKDVVYEHAIKGDIYLVQKREPAETLFIAIKASKIPIRKLIPLSYEAVKEGKAVYHGE